MKINILFANQHRIYMVKKKRLLPRIVGAGSRLKKPPRDNDPVKFRVFRVSVAKNRQKKSR